jgi:hypothetical protein
MSEVLATNPEVEIQAAIDAKLAHRRMMLREYAAKYGAKNKQAILVANRAYFEKKKTDIEFMTKHRASMLLSMKKRALENKKENPKPVRPYTKRPPPNCLGESSLLQN